MICIVTSTCVVNRKGEREKKYKILNQISDNLCREICIVTRFIPWGNTNGLLARQDHFWTQFNIPMVVR